MSLTSIKLIQRNLNPAKPGRGYLAFDKCTLLSSQGSDTPTRPSHHNNDQPRRATSQSYPTRTVCPNRLIDDLGSSGPAATAVPGGGLPIIDPKVDTLNREKMRGCSPLEGAGPSGLSALPCG